MDGIDYVRSESWIGLEGHWLDILGVVLALNRVFCFNPAGHFCNGRLIKEYIGETILNVFVEDTNAIMNNECWLIFE